jgi:NAD-dependent deacetylase
LVDFQKYFDEFNLITQNVDGLHRKAGSEKVIELHGNIRRNKCIQCGKIYESLEEAVGGTPPKCPCGGNIRPDVVWFGEMLPQDTINYAFAVSQKCDLFFSVGTSAVVHPAASLPLLAKRSGAYVVEINISPTEITHIVDESLLGKSGEILPYLVRFFN